MVTCYTFICLLDSNKHLRRRIFLLTLQCEMTQSQHASYINRTDDVDTQSKYNIKWKSACKPEKASSSMQKHISNICPHLNLLLCQNYVPVTRYAMAKVLNEKERTIRLMQSLGLMLH